MGLTRAETKDNTTSIDACCIDVVRRFRTKVVISCVLCWLSKDIIADVFEKL